MQGKEQLFISGPEGLLEAELIIPENHQNKFFVMCHPHPLFQGTMDNKVVTTMTRAMNDLGFISLRFNYRGVGKSVGTYDRGRGEVEDALAVIHYLTTRFRAAQHFVLGGFSFGGFVAYQAAIKMRPDALILIAPSIPKLHSEDNPHPELEPDCPMLVIQGDSDDVIPAQGVYAWLKTRQQPYTVIEVPGASHFFHGKLVALREASQDFMRKVLP